MILPMPEGWTLIEEFGDGGKWANRQFGLLAIKYTAPEGIPTTYVDEHGKKKRRNGARHDSMIVVWVGALLDREELPGWWA